VICSESTVDVAEYAYGLVRSPDETAGEERNEKEDAVVELDLGSCEVYDIVSRSFFTYRQSAVPLTNPRENTKSAETA
jgi:hypothetical protein